jgi:hypothetical protein
MTRRDYRRSQSAAAVPPSERAYQRAERELRDFHRTRSLDVILEEDHHLLRGRSKEDDGPSGGILTKQRAVLCLADLVHDDDEEEPSGSESTGDCETADFSATTNKEHGWGHFTADSSPSESRARSIHIPVPAASSRTMRRFVRP